MDSGNLPELYRRMRETTDALQAKAAELFELAQELERLTKDTSAWCAGTRARVEARATLEQAQDLLRLLGALEGRSVGTTPQVRCARIGRGVATPRRLRKVARLG